MPKTLLMGAAGVALCVFVLSLRAQQSGPTTDKPKTAHQAFKNVQVLKDNPADQLIPSMQFITASLGVECDFCHVRDAFDKDDKKPKQTARRMMQMMFAINEQNFQGQRAVTCYSCHRGSSKPLGVPVVEATGPYISEAANPDDKAATQASSNADMPAASDILGKYVAALGGATAIEKISSRVEKGSVTFGAGPPLVVEIFTKAPDKQVMRVHLSAGDSTTVFDGQRGWVSAPGAPVREMAERDFEGARLDADLQFAIHLRTLFTEFKVTTPGQGGEYDTISPNALAGMDAIA